MKKDLKSLSNEELRERHNELAVLMGYDSDNCFTSSYNRRFRQRQKIIDELRARSAIDVLLPNLRHEEPWVRCLSASICWDVAPGEAETTLEELAQEPYATVGIQARSSLGWRRDGFINRPLPAKPRTA